MYIARSQLIRKRLSPIDLQRRASNMTRKGHCSTFNLLHNFILKSIPI